MQLEFDSKVTLAEIGTQLSSLEGFGLYEETVVSFFLPFFFFKSLSVLY